MLDPFLLVGLPYAALLVLVVGTVARFRLQRFSVSSLSSQLLEGARLPLGSVAWHIGIVVVLLGHLLPFLAPGVWRALTASHVFLHAVETLGVGAALLALAGLSVLIVRRLTSAPLQSVTTAVDVAVLGLLLLQVLLGLVVALAYPYGAAWSTGTVMPYVWSLLTLSPDAALVSDLPAVIKLHLAGAWLIAALVPFSRLVHAFVVPVGYLFRAPQRVIWASARRLRQLEALPGGDPNEARRHLLKAGLGMATALVLVGAGVLDKVVRFLHGDDMSPSDKEALANHRLQRLEQTAAQRSLELERMRQEIIPVATLGELGGKQGKYFIDYEMRPALAFRGADGLPLLISAKCTHLGCTVGSAVDEQGRILCPCHISYFDVRTGKPNAGSPAKEPLPHLGWLLRDGSGRVVASRAGIGPIEGKPDPATLDQLEVCITRPEASA